MDEQDHGFTLGTVVLLQSAQTNFSNLEQLNPMLKYNPMWHLAMRQLNAVVERMTRGQSDG
jgi:hypothetical protein